jgi:hypothetical protein
MDTIPRRRALAAGAALVLVACSDEAPPPQDDARAFPEYAGRLAEIAEEDSAVAAWIEEHRDALPTDYDELVQLPSAYRVAVALELPSAAASAILREHFRRAIASRPEMTAEQRELIAATSDFVSPAWVATERQTRVMAWHAVFGQRIDRAFTLAERIRVFESIGPEDDGIRARIADVTAPASGDHDLAAHIDPG